jgi:hypothetical protein
VTASDAARVPHHRRSVVTEVLPSDDPTTVDVVGRLRDERPWADHPLDLPLVHDLELVLTVSLTDFCVRAARVGFHTYPHAECVQIEAAHQALVGAQVGRGWNTAVRERLGGPSGCTHLREIARQMGPVMMQAAFSARVRARRESGAAEVDDPQARALLPLIADTCHVWAVGGVAEQKLERGWRPGTTLAPIPPVAAFPPAPPA